ncbi:Exopolyphosphatase [Rhodovastum atsumiense]|uniref:Ppx/GppA family phosphatase n=1 Tax=Rhodovastum atsumiense TaxID=504468 RepID=A0A5M6J0V2_9PROT|nr:Ppx/GppA phosphatase family protein [Rhodovastum atsumiense]KAA5614141.1 Ppx/GppA family phosphatase [Rhodovastum atsumiense]CAH2598992.1 Exopolyphosphatase [Rhodovastum atsumiense]
MEQPPDDDALARPLELDPDWTSRSARPPYAIIDIGSNSVRLVVYDRIGRAPLPRFNEKSLCRLGADLDRTGEIPPESFRRTVAAGRRFRAVAEAMEVGRIDVLATEAIRRANNGAALVAALAGEAGLQVRVLAGAEEARFAALGVIAGFYRPRGLVGDMGGGSLELAEVLDDRVGDRTASLPLGALPVQAMLAEFGDKAKQRVDAVLAERLSPALTEPVFHAVGGGWRSFARVHMASRPTPVPVTHGYSIEAGEARDFAGRVWRLPEPKLTALPGLARRRVATLRASALVLDRVLKRLAPERVVFSALGVREGWIYAHLPMAERSADPLVEAAQSLGLPQARVPGFARALAHWTDGLFPAEVAAERRLRLAACALSDIAWRDHIDVRATESFRRLVQFPFIGIDHAERVFLAAVIHGRYAGAPNDPALAPAIGLLSKHQRRRALILGRVLLLGYRFSGGVPEILASARLRIEADMVRLEIAEGARVPDSEVVRDRLGLVAAALGLSRIDIREVSRG